MTAIDERPVTAPAPTITAAEIKLFHDAARRHTDRPGDSDGRTRAGLAAVRSWWERHPGADIPSDLVPVPSRAEKDRRVAAGWTCKGVGLGPNGAGVYWLEDPSTGDGAAVDSGR